MYFRTSARGYPSKPSVERSGIESMRVALTRAWSNRDARPDLKKSAN